MQWAGLTPLQKNKTKEPENIQWAGLKPIQTKSDPAKQGALEAVKYETGLGMLPYERVPFLKAQAETLSDPLSQVPTEGVLTLDKALKADKERGAKEPKLQLTAESDKPDYGKTGDSTAQKYSYHSTPLDATPLGITANTLTGLPEAAGDVTKEALRGSARALGGFGTDLLRAVSLGHYKGPDLSSPAAKFIYGPNTQYLSTIKAGRELRMANPNKESHGFMKPVDFALGLFSAALDGVPVGGFEKKGVELAVEEMAKTFAKSTADDEIRSTLMSVFGRANEDTVNLLKNSTSKNDAQNILQNQYRDEISKAKELDKQSKDLINEAKKYKSPEEFQKAISKKNSDLQNDDITAIYNNAHGIKTKDLTSESKQGLSDPSERAAHPLFATASREAASQPSRAVLSGVKGTDEANIADSTFKVNKKFPEIKDTGVAQKGKNLSTKDLFKDEPEDGLEEYIKNGELVKKGKVSDGMKDGRVVGNVPKGLTGQKQLKGLDVRVNHNNATLFAKRHGVFNVKDLVKTLNRPDFIMHEIGTNGKDHLTFVKTNNHGFSEVAATRVNGFAVVHDMNRSLAETAGRTAQESAQKVRDIQNRLNRLLDQGDLIYSSGRTTPAFADRLTKSGTLHPSGKTRVSASLSDVGRTDNGSISDTGLKVNEEKGNPDFSTNLIKFISESDTPGPIIDALRAKYSKISDKTLGLFAKRLVNLKRTGDIEGHLKTLTELAEAVEKKDLHTVLQRQKKLFEEGHKVTNPKTLDTLPKSTVELMSEEEQDEYINNISQTLKKDKESVALSQGEYDSLWDLVNQKVVDRYEELQLQRSFIEDSLSKQEAGKELSKYVSRTTGGLPEVTGEPTIKSLTGSGKSMKNSKFGIEGDQIMDRYGFKYETEAEEAIAKYQQTKKDLLDINDKLRELRPKMRAAKILSPILEEVPVISREKAAGLDSLADEFRVRNQYKDISGFAGGFKDLWRNFEKYFGKSFYEAKALILDPFDDAKGAMTDEITKLAKELKDNIETKYKIRRGSKEDEAIQRYGDTSLDAGNRLTRDQLYDKFGGKRAEQIIAADKWFRSTYDRLIDEINESRAKIYPNNPDRLISKRTDYYRHFQELGEDFKGIYDILFETPSGIDPKLAGISDFTSPKSKFLSFAQTRKGNETQIGAMGGFIDYANAFAYAKHIDPQIGNFRYLRKILANAAEQPGTRHNKEIVEGSNHFLQFLNDFANKLSGKTNPPDRWLQTRIPGGRKTFQVISRLNNRIKANVIIGNLSSALAQTLNLPNGIASAKQFMIPGLRRSIASIWTRNEPMEVSTFLKERYLTRIDDQFKIDWANHKIKRGTQEAKQFALWLLRGVDGVSTKAIWNAHYVKGVAESVDDPVRYADFVTRKLVAGRGVGEVPIDQESKLSQLIAPFQVEVQNAWYVIGDLVKARDFAGLVLLAGSSYLLNESIQKIRGSRGSYDPINALIQGSIELEDEMKAGDTKRGVEKFLGRQLGEVLSNVYMGQTLAAAIPESLPYGMKKEDFFGQGNPSRYGTSVLILSSLSDPLYKLIPPFGGSQIKKTAEGIQAMLSGKVLQANGKLNYDVKKTIPNIVQSVLFGKYATEEAQKAFSERDDLFQRIYRQDADRTEFNMEAEKKWVGIKKINDSKGKPAAVAAMKNLEKTDPKMLDAVMTIAKEEKKGLNGSDRLIKMLGVRNGERAKYLVEQLNDLDTKDEKVKYLQSLGAKGLISDQVFAQIQYLLSEK